MTENAEESAVEPAPKPVKQSRSDRTQRRKMIQFVVLFPVYVLTILIGYRYSVNSEINMRYLFQVAKHTSAILGFVGEESDVQRNRKQLRASTVRHHLQAWRNGEEVDPANGAIDETDTSIPTPLDAWLYTAYLGLQNGKSLNDFGPHVFFLYKAGIRTRLRNTYRDIARVNSNSEISPEEKEKRVARLQDRAAELTKQRELTPTGRERENLLRDRAFGFLVVPDCGAIPSIGIFVAAILAFPARWWKRIVGLLVGTPVLYGINLGRLSTLAVIAANDDTPGQKWFTFTHEYVWQGIFIIFVVAVWMCWIELLVQGRRS